MRFFLKLAVAASVGLAHIADAQTIPTGAERQEVLDAHNQARSETAVQFNVANMPALVWSDAAAEHGRAWLEERNCFSGGALAHSDSYGAGFGENIAYGYQTWTQAIYDGWHASELGCYEAVAPEWEQCSCTCGHMTAVNWADTTVVGCAICASNNAYICNYGESAPNYYGQDVFDANSGAPCSACPSNMANCVDNLCTNGTGTDGGATNPPIVVEDACDGARADAACCTDAAPCGLNEGDCDLDSHCEGNLVCGENNCNTRGLGFPDETWDCCVQPEAAPGGTGGTTCALAASGRTHQASGAAYTYALADADGCCDSCQGDASCRSFTVQTIFGTNICTLYSVEYDGTGASSSGVSVYNLE